MVDNFMKESFFPRPPRTGQRCVLLLKTEDVPCAKNEEEFRKEIQRLNDVQKRLGGKTS
jgi:hypothetical protein